jgi:hypothetical protein
MRWMIALVIASLGCSGSDPGAADPPFTPAAEDSDLPSDAQPDDVQPEVTAETSVADSALDARVDAAAETATDPFAELCKDFGTPLEPPTKCDASGGNTSTQIPSNHVYSTSWFGCYKKPDGTIYKDPTDNCEFACGNKGLCSSSMTGPECESSLQWFAADADRYGCGSRIRVTNCVNHKQVVLVTLDRGPNCGAEKSFGTPVVDMGHAAMVYLFDGKTYGGSDHKRVVIEKVASTTPLGPVD